MSDYAKTVSEAIIRQLEQGTAPWVKPWQPGQRYLPFNAVTGNVYKGMNAVWLLSVAEAKGYSDNRWMTYKQANTLDAQVNKGEKGTLIQFWKWQEDIPKVDEEGRPVLDDNGKPVKITVRLQRPQVRSAVVFNAWQISGLPALEAQPTLSEWERHQEAEAIIRDSGAVIRHMAGDKAFYRPSTDSITLPLREQFAAADRYYATALHELGHWTGHESRLNRDICHPFGSIRYAKEELRAEIASMMLGEQLGIGHDPGQHVAYIGSWIQVLQEDPREIFRASADAERMVQYLRGREMTQEQSPVQASSEIQAPVLAIQESVMPDSPLERLYLAVPYGEKDQAKALGAAWDRAAKAWYVGPKGDREVLIARWGKENALTQTSLDPSAEFAQALRAAGLVIDGWPVMDGELRRVAVEGDAKGERSGAYVGFTDGHPAGFIQNFKTGLDTTWKASQRIPALSAKDRAQLDAEAAEKRALRAKEREALAEQTAELVKAHWQAGEPAKVHPYLSAKGVQAYGLRINTRGSLALQGGKTDEAPQRWSGNGELLVPVLDQDGRFWAAQSIDDSGRKSFPRGSRLQCGHFPIGELTASDTILIAEGYATAATLHALTGLPVVVAFHSGNLPLVAEIYREKFPEKILVIAGDNDHAKPVEKNVGRLKAQEAAQAVGGYALVPEFEKDAPGSDWNDLWKIQGTARTQDQLHVGLNQVKAQHQAARELEKERKASRVTTSEKALAAAGGRNLTL
jgi:antirestriction protein ArdC/phage/plasmid primase-like uncharacterized protein